ncbi:GPW/gp25 family protein [Shewanella sp.]|uniref:GPW/gp25 family protein n=1 Tax=Shewanella sp. TaxID=50422 RepID=UPI003A9860D6
MNVTTGRSISTRAHISQSIQDILCTPIGSRVMRRNYGSALFQLIDQPQHGATRLRLMAATVDALTQWEPRIQINAVALDSQALNGKLAITLDVQRTDTQTDEQFQVNYG